MLLLLRSSKKKILHITKNNFPIFNVGTGKNISIKNLMVNKIIGYNGEIKFNSLYPDGTKEKI